MKKIIYFLSAALLCMSCESFLDTENLTKKDTSNFPVSSSDTESMINGIYSTLNQGLSDPQATYFFISELAADDRFGGGGENDRTFTSVDHLMNSGPDQYKKFWEARYKGIFRVNTALELLDNCDINEETLKRYKGESHFLRAFFFHEFVSSWNSVTHKKVMLCKQKIISI